MRRLQWTSQESVSVEQLSQDSNIIKEFEYIPQFSRSTPINYVNPVTNSFKISEQLYLPLAADI